MTEYRVPLPARSGPADAADLGVERWACGVAASYEEWPPDRYEWRLPEYGLPLRVDHREQMFASSGAVDGTVGAVRRFAQVDSLVVCLIEVTSPSVMWDWSRGVRCGLSVMSHVDEPPAGGPAWVYFSEVSLTGHPKDPLARVVSLGQAGLDDWRALTGEEVTP